MDIKKNDELDPLAIIFCSVFIIMAAFLLYVGIGSLAIVSSNGPYVMISMALLVLIGCSFGLWSISKTINTIIVVYVVSLLSVSFFAQDTIQQRYVASQYEHIDEMMTGSYSGIVNTPVYKDFLVYKAANDGAKIQEYNNNINKYISTNPEKVMQLKIFYTATNNKEIQSKLDDVFKDGLVSRTEYEDFKQFAYQLDLTANDQSLISMITN